MAVKITDKKTGAATSLTSIIATMKAKTGDKSVMVVSDMKSEDDSFSEVERLPSGIFAFDYATGGGFPVGKVSILTGPEGAGKTNVTLKTIRQAQLIDPDKYQVFIDIENHFDPHWASQFGLDMTKLILVKCESGEDAVNKTEGVMMAHDVNLVIVDSLAMLVSLGELEGDADRAAVGGSSALIGKMMRKITARLSQLSILDIYPTVICINQIRFKIGVMFGNPESQPGGMAPKHMSGLTCRLYSKDITQEKDPVVYWRETDMVVQKKKVPTMAKKAVWRMAIDITPAGEPVGYIDDWNLLLALLKDQGSITQNGKSGWLFFGEEFKTQAEIKAKLYGDEKLLQRTKTHIIETAKKVKAGTVNEQQKETT